tara:strand:- start:5251 stop:5733 length:483 start_codon:yes stop_codon:yes gene_type:complete
MNGRVNIEGHNPFMRFQLYDKIANEDKTTAYRDAMVGNWENNNLSNTFFSAENINKIQLGIITGIDKISNGRFKIGKQDEDTLKIIMRSIFLQNSKNNNINIPNQIEVLNKLVLDYCIPQIYGEAQGYIKYKNDVSTLAVPIDRPVSTYTNNSLELKKWF